MENGNRYEPHKKFQRISDNKIMKEEFNPIIGIDNFLNNPIMIVLATAWLLSGKYKLHNLKSDLKGMKDDFLDYCNFKGYAIDKDALDYKFN